MSDIPKIIDHSDRIEFVEQFDNDLRNSVRIIREKANDVYLNIAETPDASLGSKFADAMHEYRRNKNNSNKLESARKAEFWIHELIDRGLVGEGSGNVMKLHECNDALAVKEGELGEISPKYELLKQERDHLDEELKKAKTEIEKLKIQIEGK